MPLVLLASLAGCAPTTSDNHTTAPQTSIQPAPSDAPAAPVARNPIESTNPLGAWTQRTITADFNDIRAAIGIGASKAELVAVRVTSPAPNIVQAELLAVSDNTVTLVCTWLDAPADLTPRDIDPLVPRSDGVGESVRIHLAARTQPFVDTKLETKLLNGIERRLAQLHGVGVAPVR